MSSAERKAVIKHADMNEEMQQDAIDCANVALEKFNIEKDIAAYIKKEFDTNDFQRWSIWNKESNIIPNVLKKPQRDLIYELTSDKLYSYQKQKTMSGPGIFTNLDWAFLMDNGETIYFRVAFKPVSTIMQEQQSVDKNGNTVALAGKGRHDPCVVPRAVPIVESMAALVIADHLLRNRTSKL